MNLKKKNRIGFTIVELVIVIAVIAVLSAIFIPSIANLIRKAQISADVVSIRNINTQLKVTEAIDGKPTTFSQMLSVAKESGYDLNKLSPTTEGYTIVWDRNQNYLYLFDKDNKLVSNQQNQPNEGDDLWVKVSSVEEAKSETRSTFIASANLTDFSINHSFEITQKADVVLEGASGHIIVCMNGGTLTINSPNATLQSYGEKDVVNIDDVKMDSYYEYGKVNGKINLKKGHISIEKGAEVNTILITSTIDNANNLINEIKITDKSGTNIEVATNNENIASLLESVVTGTNKISVDANVNAGLFAGGLGTETNPYLINSLTDLENINSLCNDMEIKSFCFKLISNLNLCETENIIDDSGFKYYVNKLNGNFDGNNHTIIGPDKSSFNLFNIIYGNTEIKDLKYKLTNQLSYVASFIGKENTTLTLNNVDISSADERIVYSLGNNDGVYLMGWAGCGEKFTWIGNATFNFFNCDCDISISATGYNAIFVGGGNYKSTINVDSCSYSGNYYGNRIALVLGNTTNYNGVTNVSNFNNYGNLFGTEMASAIGGNSIENVPILCTTSGENYWGTLAQISDKLLNLSLNKDGYVVISKGSEEAETYKINITGGTLLRILNGKIEGEYSSSNIEIVLSNIEWNENNQYVTKFKAGKLLTREQFERLFAEKDITNENWISAKIIVSNSDTKIAIVEHNDELYYVVDIPKSGDLEFKFVSSKINDTYNLGPSKINSLIINDYNKSGVIIGSKNINV